MKKLFAAGLLLLFFFVLAAISIQFDALMPPAIMQSICEELPWTCPQITQWVLAEVPEQYVFTEDEGTLIDLFWDGDGDGVVDAYPYYQSGTVYAGGAVPFAGWQVLDPVFAPVQWGVLTDCYHVPRPGYNDHSGIDYGLPEGTPVAAPISGLVTYAGPKGDYGNLVVIEANGAQVYLAHNTEVLVSVGQVIAAGEIVALSGNTGASTGPHLHFELRACDPQSGYCRPTDPFTTLLPGQTETFDWYFGGQSTTTY
ncbi:MAG: M23 family metallopeptidase, partial [Anaerolineales bacterium]|nr:M23 family metallopeptidase [Anaerolineales bacterium]